MEDAQHLLEVYYNILGSRPLGVVYIFEFGSSQVSSTWYCVLYRRGTCSWLRPVRNYQHNALIVVAWRWTLVYTSLLLSMEW